MSAKAFWRTHRRADLDDLMSAAYVGLVEAASKFDETRNTDFAAYARRYIYCRMRDEVRGQLKARGLSRGRTGRSRVSHYVRRTFFVPMELDSGALLADVEGITGDHDDVVGSILSREQAEFYERLLTRRERIIVDGVKRGRGHGDIARRLGCSVSCIDQVKRRMIDRIRRQWDAACNS
jgi:RNA polymerase sigma factor (sigma-70 family)